MTKEEFENLAAGDIIKFKHATETNRYCIIRVHKIQKDIVSSFIIADNSGYECPRHFEFEFTKDMLMLTEYKLFIKASRD